MYVQYLAYVLAKFRETPYDEPSNDQAVKMCDYINSKLSETTSNVVLVDKSYGDSIEGVKLLLKQKCLLHVPVVFFNLTDVDNRSAQETLTKVLTHKFVRLMPQLPYNNWNTDIDRVVTEHINQDAVQTFLKCYYETDDDLYS